MAGGAGFVNSYVHDGTDALTRYLHEAEFAQRQDVMTSSVALHQLAHVFVELLTVLGRLHIDEINNDDEAYDKKGRQLLDLCLTDDHADDFLIAICGWNVDSLLEKL